MQTRARSRSHENLARSTTARKPVCKRKTSSSMPWEPLVDTLLSVVCMALDLRIEVEWRDTVGQFLDACMVLCRESSATVDGYHHARHVLFYERWRRHRLIDLDECSLFLEMWPPFVPLDGPFTGTAVSDATAVKRLDVRAAVADRKACVSALESQSTNLEVVRTRFYAPDLPTGVPLSVNIFVGRARFMFNAIKLYTRTRRRLCLSCVPRMLLSVVTSASDEDEDESINMKQVPPIGSVQSQHEYWRMWRVPAPPAPQAVVVLQQRVSPRDARRGGHRDGHNLNRAAHVWPQQGRSGRVPALRAAEAERSRRGG